MSKARIRMAEEWAASAWKRLDLSPPVDLDKVRASLSLRLRQRPLPGDQDGGIVRAPKTTYILVNSYHRTERQRFTIAHEIGEYLLIRHYERTGRRLAQGELRERFCDRFAAALLMPEELVRQMALEVGHDRTKNDKTAVLAGRFEVSFQAMKKRLWELGINSYRSQRLPHDQAALEALGWALAEQIAAESRARTASEGDSS